MKDRNGKHISAHLILNITWVALSLCLLLLVLYFTWQKEQLQSRQALFQTSDTISDKLDNFVGNIMQDVYKLPIQGDNLKTCPPKLLLQLQRLVFNNPQISGVVIQDLKHTSICSTMPAADKQIIPATKQLTLTGPIQMANPNKPAFIIQQRIGDYLINVYFLQQIIEQILKTSAPIAQLVALYNGNQDKIVLQVQRHSTSGHWQNSKLQDYLSNPALDGEDDSVQIRMPLNDLDNFQLIVIGDPDKISQVTWKHEVIATLIIIILSFLIYYYLRTVINKHFSLHRAMLLAIKNNHFYPVYQPVCDKNLGICRGVEVLLRWRTNDKEIIMPDYFIKDAEQSGLIVPITVQLIEKTFQECQQLLHTQDDFYLAFNLSAIHFEEEQFFINFGILCDKYRIPPNQIMLEITERDLLSQDDLMLIQRMEALREAGFSLAIDDFGTGHASIGYLQHFPFNYLKIDQIFIRAIGTGAITEILNQSIIQMAKNLKLNIIAEGVETLAQLEALQDHGVYLMQGWYFASAMPIEQLLQFIKKESL